MAFENKSTAGNLIENLAKIKGKTRTEVCSYVGIVPTASTRFLNSDIRFEMLLQIVNKLGYDVVITPSKGMGNLRIVNDDPCDGCRFKKFTEDIGAAISKLNSNQPEEVDFN